MADDDGTPPVQPLGTPEAEHLEGAYAAWDVDLARFVGGVHRGPKGKNDARNSRHAKAARDAGHTVEVRQV